MFCTRPERKAMYLYCVRVQHNTRFTGRYILFTLRVVRLEAYNQVHYVKYATRNVFRMRYWNNTFALNVKRSGCNLQNA